MIDISVKEVKKAYDDGIDILDGLSFDVQAGEHIGILGRNGCGKTTLFKILSREIDYDAGSVNVSSGKRLGLISQIPVYPEEYTTEDVLMTAHARVFRLAEKIEELTKRMERDASPAVLAEYDRLAAEFERLGGNDVDFERNRVANGLDIPAEMRARLFDQLSGGEKTRVNLARLILEDTDILLLDEPTNHLDLRSTEWLEDYVLHFRGTVLAISHDRWFLDTVAKRCIEIIDGKAEFYAGNYSFFLEEKARRAEERRRLYEKERAEIDRLSATARKMHEHNTEHLHKRAFSIEKRIEKLRTTSAPERERELKARFREKDFFGDEVLYLEGVGKSFGGKKLFENVELLVEGGERIALIGDNGAGKSTFLKILMDEEAPDTGRFSYGPTVKAAYLPQIIHFERPERTLYDTMLFEARCSPQEARDRLAAFSFTGDEVFKRVETLSGGELSRLRLCMLMRADVNLLILDEPTNHLDIASREWIEDAVAAYGGALLFVSHDRWFIRRFAERVWWLHDGVITDFKGGFDAFREFQAKQKQAVRPVPEAKKKEPSPPKKERPKTDKKLLAKTEREIVKTEEKLAALEAEAEHFFADYQKLMEIEEQRSALNKELEALYEKWEVLSE